MTDQKTIIRLYNYRLEHSGKNYELWRQRVWRLLTTHFFQKFISRNDVLVDLPCGFGEFINNVVCKEKIAIDIRPDSKKFLNKNVKFLRCLSTKIKLPSGSVDKFFVSNFFEHISRDDIVKTIRETRRVLKPGGKVLVFQPNIRFIPDDFWMFFDHLTPIDDRALDEVFFLEGFDLEYKVERFFPYTLKSRLPKLEFLVSLYLHLPSIWFLFGEQSFLVYKKR